MDFNFFCNEAIFDNKHFFFILQIINSRQSVHVIIVEISIKKMFVRTMFQR